MAGRTINKDGTPHDLGIFERVIRINLIGTFNVIRLAAAAMATTDPVDEFGTRGAIVNTSSVAGIEGQTGQAAYSASKGGVIGITAYAPFIRSDRPPTLGDYLDHIDYVVDRAGIDHVSFATDWFDGKTKTNWATPWYYPEVTRGSQYGALGLAGFGKRSELRNLVAGLLDRGRSATDIGKILGGNYLRVLQAVWR